MAIYRITNRITKESGQAYAPSAQDACQRLGWMIGDCFVQEVVTAIGTISCARCGGLGEIRPAGNAPDETEVCPACQGTGRTEYRLFHTARR